jgi:hypothetical protein
MRSLGETSPLGTYPSKVFEFRSDEFVASRFPYTVVQRVRGARLISRGFCPIDKSTIWWDTTQTECILLPAGGVNEISVCAAGEKQSGKRHYR